MVPENSCQKVWGIFTKVVLTFKRRVKRMTETPSEVVTTTTLLKLVPPDNEPPTITGNKEIVQGASTVSIPANNEIKNNIIVLSSICFYKLMSSMLYITHKNYSLVSPIMPKISRSQASMWGPIICNF